MRLAFLALTVPVICLAQTQAQPRLTLDSLDHDFGRIAPNTTVVHRFKATNTGGAPLTIAKLVPACGCTSTLIGKETLAPGESTELEVTFNSAGASGPTHKTVQVLSNDPVDPAQTLNFEADVIQEIKASTDEVRFEDLVRSDRRQTTVKLESGTGQAIQLNHVELSKAPWLGVTTREVGQDLYVDFDLLASRLPPNRLSGVDTVTLQMANPNHSVVRLSVQWALRPPVIATPVRVAWDEPTGQDLRRTIQLVSRDRKPFRILSARTSNPVLQVLGVSSKALASQGIQLRIPPTVAPGVYEETATLTLDTPGHPEFEIRVSASLH